MLPPVVFPDRVAGHLYVEPPYARLTDPDDRAKAEAKFRKKQADKAASRQDELRKEFDILQEFRKTLPKVQRALANVPTYMILDDHDVTDDYFLNPIWRDRVLTSALGLSILRNAMTAYAVFQDWGNDPVKYADGPRAQLLDPVARLFPPGAVKGPDQQAADHCPHLFGHDLRNAVNPIGRYDSVTPPILWCRWSR